MLTIMFLVLGSILAGMWWIISTLWEMGGVMGIIIGFTLIAAFGALFTSDDY